MEIIFRYLDIEKIDVHTSEEIKTLDHLAFHDAKPKDENWPSKWSNPTWMVLGRLNDVLVSQLCLLRRDILVGGKKVETVGVGGVATHPNWQRKGFAKQLLAFTEIIIRDKLQSKFAMLLCEGMPCSIYRKAGWKDIADYIIYHDNGICYPLESNVMVFETSEIPFPEGEIDVCGLPW